MAGEPHVTDARSMRVYDADTDSLLASQNRDPLLAHLTATVVALSERWAPASGGARAIDIGCGTGRTALALARGGYRVVGFDPSERIIELARQAAAQAGFRVEFSVGDATSSPDPDWLGAFDLAVCSEVIEHVEAPGKVIALASAVLRPGGCLILTAPHDQRQWTVMDTYAGHVRRFAPTELARLLAGLDLLDLATEGFPFQRLAMWAYGRMANRPGYEHEFANYGDTPAYRLYRAVMPFFLHVDHVFRHYCRGTTLVAVARRPGDGVGASG